MYSFKSKIADIAVTSEQYEQKCRRASDAAQCTKTFETAKAFCNCIKDYIEKCAQRGEYEIHGDSRIIRGYAYAWRHCSCEDGYETRYGIVQEIKSGLGYCFSVPDQYGRSLNRVIGGGYPEINYKIKRFKFGNGVLHSDKQFVWEISFFADGKLNGIISSKLGEDGINTNHLFVILREKECDYRGTKPEIQISTDDSVTVKKAWGERVGVYYAYGFTFEF